MDVYSQERQKKAKNIVEVRCKKEREKMEKALKKLSTEEFLCPDDAKGALKRCFSKSKFYEILEGTIEEEKKYESKGRPKQESSYKLIYRITGILQKRQAARQEAILQSSCFVVGTTISQKELNDAEVIMAYKNQNNTVERGFRFLKNPLMFTSSLFVKKPRELWDY
jgi:transposase